MTPRSWFLLLSVTTFQTLAATPNWNCVICNKSNAPDRVVRSIDLMTTHNLHVTDELPDTIRPLSYMLDIIPYPENGTYSGSVKIHLLWTDDTDRIYLHGTTAMRLKNVHLEKIIDCDEISECEIGTSEESVVPLNINEYTADPKLSLIRFQLNRVVTKNSQYYIDLDFDGQLSNRTGEGFFYGSYVDSEDRSTKWFAATNFRPNLARTVFPCFDEPRYKASFIVKVGRRNSTVALSNTPIEATQDMDQNPGWLWDLFSPTLQMPVYTLGIVVSDFDTINFKSDKDAELNITIRVWARRDFLQALENVTEKVYRAIVELDSFWNSRYPLSKIDLVAVPNYQASRPADNWGLLIFRESELSGSGSWHIYQELVYQWLGAMVTPYRWSDAHINNALVRYVTAYLTMKLDKNETFNNWPMTMLYSIYYEFSKRYPHGKSTIIKQDSVSAKTELLFRMFNYTLGSSFQKGLQRFIAKYKFKHFTGDDIWNCLSDQAQEDNIFNKSYVVSDIAATWIMKDRLPVVTVIRNFDAKTANVTQRMYLRERPHDVPDQDKFLWTLPIVMLREDEIDNWNWKPVIWMTEVAQQTIENLPDSDKFIIVNPEEIGPFPVNYDLKNWNMLSNFLCSSQRTKIPVNTRAKLLHDAWNLAYAGDLSFATALNMTLFLKDEREYVAWDPFFTLIDHIGRHIDSSEVHQKFQTYVRLLLTPLYRELGDDPLDNESEGQLHLRSSSKIFLCQAGYKPCIENAQNEFKKWIESANPNEGNPVSNQYICPVFKWGTMEEWNFGLQRIIDFPANRKPSERTYLLKTLAGCPNDAHKIERLLNITILEQNGNFTDKDIYLIFTMLTGNSNGYTTLFKFLERNWDILHSRFHGKLHLWNSLITSATTAFKTQAGLDMVSNLYEEKKTELGTADFVVEKALKNIKEEAKWSNDNLPIIEHWLDHYLKANNVN